MCTHLCLQQRFHVFLILFFFKLYNIVLVLPYIEMNPPQAYMCSPSGTLLPPPSPYHPSGSSQCTSPKHPVSYRSCDRDFRLDFHISGLWVQILIEHRTLSVCRPFTFILTGAQRICDASSVKEYPGNLRVQGTIFEIF